MRLGRRRGAALRGEARAASTQPARRGRAPHMLDVLRGLGAGQGHLSLAHRLEARADPAVAGERVEGGRLRRERVPSLRGRVLVAWSSVGDAVLVLVLVLDVGDIQKPVCACQVRGLRVRVC
jgi:hypothetical protein